MQEPIPLNIGKAAEETLVSNMLGMGEAAEDASKSVQSFNDVYFSDKFRARERLNENEYKRRRARNKAAKKSRRKNRGN